MGQMKGKRHFNVGAFQTSKLGKEPPDDDKAKKN